MAAAPRAAPVPASRRRSGRPGGSGPTVDVRAMLAPLWRGMVAYRVVALVYAVVNVVRFGGSYALPVAAFGVVVAMAAWTAFTSVRYLRGARTLTLADLALTVAATLSTRVVESPARIAEGAPVITTVWSAGAVLAVAVAYGMRAGLAAGLVSALALIAVRQTFDADLLSDVQLLVVVGLAVGLAANTMRRSARRLQEAIAAEAATAERERLARHIHDGVLQVLSFVRRRGVEIGGGGAELSRLAGEQETSLRRLITSGPPRQGADPDDPDAADLAAELGGVLPARASLALPPGPVRAPRGTVAALVAVVREAVANADEHAGPDAGLWVFVEDEEDAITVTVRDDGRGIGEGRLAEAVAGGHLGVVSSIRGRVRDLGGTAELVTAPGAGTEWEIRVPREAGR